MVEYVHTPLEALIVCPFPQEIETVVASVVLHVTFDVREDTQTLGLTLIELQAGLEVLLSGSQAALQPSVPHPLRVGSFGSHASRGLPFRIPSPQIGPTGGV